MEVPGLAPVLVMGFNRPRHLERVLSAVVASGPRRVYLSLDGPRAQHIGDIAALAECTEVVQKTVGINLVNQLVRSVNLGCGRAVSDAVTWFLSHEPEGIILEDDTVPSHEFFALCDQLLPMYRNEPRVFGVVGCSLISNPEVEEPFSFLPIPLIWGWATWREAWEHYDFERRCIPIKEVGLRRAIRGSGSFSAFVYWCVVSVALKFARVDTWDYQWAFTAIAKGAVFATPARNLVTNIGFDGTGTHGQTLDPSEKSRIPKVRRLPSHLPQLEVITSTKNLNATIRAISMTVLRRRLNCIARLIKGVLPSRVG